MKTKEQILEWLDTQPWKNEFYEAYFRYGISQPEYNIALLSAAFDWSATGFVTVWGDREEAYKKWYRANDKPMSWSEYLNTSHPIKGAALKMQAYIDNDTELLQCGMSKELCVAFLAYTKLIPLRNAWMKDDVRG